MIFTTVFTTIIWIGATFVTKPDSKEQLEKFYDRVKPKGIGWNKINTNNQKMLPAIINAILGVISIQGFLFGVGKIIFGELLLGIIWFIFACISIIILLKRI